MSVETVAETKGGLVGYFKELDIMIRNHEMADFLMYGKWNAVRILAAIRWDLLAPVDNNRYEMVCRVSDHVLTVNKYTQER